MDEGLLELLPLYGLPVLGLVVAAGCFGLPVPASLLMLVAGSFAAAGDFDPGSVFATCLGGALLADNLGYLLGRVGGAALAGRLAPGLAAAQALLAARGGLAIFLSRWLVTPLGAPVNLLAGAARMPWRRFLLFDLAGEVLWVVLYLGLGAAFSGIIVDLAAVLANATAAAAFAVLAAGLGWLLWRHRAPG